MDHNTNEKYLQHRDNRYKLLLERLQLQHTIEIEDSHGSIQSVHLQGNARNLSTPRHIQRSEAFRDVDQKVGSPLVLLNALKMGIYKHITRVVWF